MPRLEAGEMWISQHKRLRRNGHKGRRLEKCVPWDPHDKIFQRGGRGKYCQKLWIDQLRQKLKKKKKSPLDLATRYLETWKDQFWGSDRGESLTRVGLRKNGRRNGGTYRPSF